MKNISCGLAAVFSLVVLINNANAETWGKFETDSRRIEEKNIKNKAVISDDFFDETTKEELASVKKIEALKNIKSKKISMNQNKNQRKNAAKIKNKIRTVGRKTRFLPIAS
ncbi:MAG: hypothetical protein K6C34_05210 [Alphaproteobacteria bacterium]|nr:hypothetical protein [Alphaproteobacteria bacterium]